MDICSSSLISSITSLTSSNEMMVSFHCLVVVQKKNWLYISSKAASLLELSNEPLSGRKGYPNARGVYYASVSMGDNGRQIVTALEEAHQSLSQKIADFKTIEKQVLWNKYIKQIWLHFVLISLWLRCRVFTFWTTTVLTSDIRLWNGASWCEGVPQEAQRCWGFERSAAKEYWSHRSKNRKSSRQAYKFKSSVSQHFLHLIYLYTEA